MITDRTSCRPGFPDNPFHCQERSDAAVQFKKKAVSPVSVSISTKTSGLPRPPGPRNDSLPSTRGGAADVAVQSAVTARRCSRRGSPVLFTTRLSSQSQRKTPGCHGLAMTTHPATARRRRHCEQSAATTRQSSSHKKAVSSALSQKTSGLPRPSGLAMTAARHPGQIPRAGNHCSEIRQAAGTAVTPSANGQGSPSP